MTFNRLIALFLLLMASAWVALVNGQPLFMTDSTAYVRGPDFAVVYFLGSKFATSWTQKRTLEGLQTAAGDATTKPAAQDIRLNSPFDKAILSGRSIYYGALLYLGHLTSYFWLSVFLQAAIFVYLSYTLLVTCLRFSIFTLTCVDLAILVATPISFFISTLMPDVFASFLILSTIILVTFWDALRFFDRVIISAVLLYSELTHTSHLVLFVCLIFVYLCVAIAVKGRALFSTSFPRQLAVLLILAMGGGLGELAFLYGTQLATGAYPVRPPFVMARVIADGPGYKFLKQNCATKPYTVCRYIDRLPTNAMNILWSDDPKTGVFVAADPATRRAISSEQTSFILDVLRFDPIGLTVSATKNAIDQFLSVGLNEIFLLNFLTPQQVLGFEEKLPALYREKLLHARIVFKKWILAPANIWFSSVYYFSIVGLILMCAFWPSIQSRMKPNDFPQPQWFYGLTIAASAMVINAMICGVLAEPAPRYQARISWIPLILLLPLAVRLWESRWPVKNEPELMRQLAERLPRPLRFLGIGTIGLATDLGTFTIIAALGPHALIARLGSLAIATMVTWRLNRALTFDPSGRRQHEEAVRYAIVTVIAQGTSYAIFAVLVLTVLAALPQVAIVIGAAIGALLSYKGHRLLSFAPKVAYSPP